MRDWQIFGTYIKKNIYLYLNQNNNSGCVACLRILLSHFNSLLEWTINDSLFWYRHKLILLNQLGGSEDKLWYNKWNLSFSVHKASTYIQKHFYNIRTHRSFSKMKKIRLFSYIKKLVVISPAWTIKRLYLFKGYSNKRLYFERLSNWPTLFLAIHREK